MEVEFLWTREQEIWTRDQAIGRFGYAGKCAGRFVQRQLNGRTTISSPATRGEYDEDKFRDSRCAAERGPRHRLRSHQAAPAGGVGERRLRDYRHHAANRRRVVGGS